MTILFAVFRQGQYRHECGGIFDSPAAAGDAARALAAGDTDDHHDYWVVPFTLNEPTPVAVDDYVPSCSSPRLVEAEPSLICRNGGTPGAVEIRGEA